MANLGIPARVGTPVWVQITKNFVRYLKWRVSWTWNKAILGVGKLPYISRIHTAYIGFRTSILGTNEMFGEQNVFKLFFSTWVVPPPSKSHHQDYYIFSRESL